MRPTSPIPWFGGKGNMIKKLLPYIPEHEIYVEPFGGAAALLFAKAPAPVEVYNDLNSGLVNLFRVLRDPGKFERFYRLATLTPYSREEFRYCRATWEDTQDDVERAYRFFVVARMSFGGRFGASWSYVVKTFDRRIAATTLKYLCKLEQLPAIADRIMCVQIEHRPGLEVIEAFDTPETFFYLDPPYLHRTRKSKKHYRHEMSDEDHERLLDAILQVEGMVLLSGYPDPIYTEALSGWHYQEWETVCHAAGKTRATGLLGKGAILKAQGRTEAIWWNEACEENRDPSQLRLNLGENDG